MNEAAFNNLEEAVLCFYQSNNVLQAEAQKWLTELQNSPQVWKAIWEELLPSKRTELQFYGATILHSKLLKDWSDVPAEEYEPLKQKLLEAVVYFKDGPKIVLNRLCITLAVYILRTTPLFWPNPISDLISLFQNAVGIISSETLTCLLLEILSVLPEEFQTIILSKNERIFVRSSLENESGAVLSLLEAAFSSSNLDIRLQVVKCAKSWLEFGLPPKNCDVLLDHLINTVLITCKNPEFSHCSINAVEAISILCSHPNAEKLPKTVISFLQKVLSLTDILNASQEVASNDLIPCLYTLFISMGESHVKVYVESLLRGEGEIFMKLLYVILQGSNAPGNYPKDEVYSIQTFNFWYQLQDEIIPSDKYQGSDIVKMIKPFYKELIVILMRKSMQPENVTDWSRDDRDSFRCYRQDIADTYMYCYPILDQELLNVIYEHLRMAMSISDSDKVSKWREIESYLFAFYAIAENVMCSNNEKISNCIILLQNLPLSKMNVQVSQTTMELLGSYAEWLCSHPQLLGPVLDLVFAGAENPPLAAPATLALKDITRECKSVLDPYAVQIAQQTANILLRKHLKSSEETRLIFSLGKVISLLPEKTIIEYLKAVVTQYFTKLETILGQAQGDKKVEQEITECVSVFTQLFLGLEVKPPVYYLLENILPIFKGICTKYKGLKVVSGICIAIKCAISNLNDDCAALLPMIIEIILITYTSNPDKHSLELAKQLLILFGNTANYSMLMSNLLKELCVLTLTTFENTTPENVSNHTTLFEHFYAFCTNVLKKNCKLLLNTDGVNLVSLFRYAGFALCAQETLTVKAAALFLCNVITVSREQPALLIVVQTHGEELVHHILIAIGKVSPRNCLEHVADVLLALSKKYCDYLSRWLRDILAKDGFPTPRATPGAKERFIKSVLKEKANKRRVQDSTKEFCFLCRGLLHKDYVEETSSSAL